MDIETAAIKYAFRTLRICEQTPVPRQIRMNSYFQAICKNGYQSPYNNR
jgi:hypothetical protein